MYGRRYQLQLVLPLIAFACGGGEKETDSMTDQPLTAPIVMSDVGFMTPESVLYDAVADVYLVSNVNGTPFDLDDNGFISRVSPAGEVVDLKWIDGAAEDVELNAPKGLAIAGNILYVADVNVIRMFDRTTGASRGAIPVPGSTFLNDVATGPDGTVYFTDSGFQPGPDGFAPSGTDAVYRLSGGAPEKIIASADLPRPNGVAVRDGAVWVVGFGANEMFRVDSGAMTDTVELPAGSLDGLVLLPNGDALISSWEAQAVFHRGADGHVMTLVSDVEAPADIGYDTRRNRVLIPLFQGNAVEIAQN